MFLKKKWPKAASNEDQRSTRSQEQVDRGMNKTYYMINEDHADREEIQQNLIYPLHDEEWPNDWRYCIIYHLLSDFVDCEDRNQIEDRIHEMIDGLVDVYNIEVERKNTATKHRE